LRYKEDYAAGKNKIINGDFGVWQRGTSFSNPATASFVADRWRIGFNGTSATRTISQQTFTPGTAPVAGYEGQYFLRWDNSVVGTGNTTSLIRQQIEDVRTFAGQTVTMSFWMKTGAARSCEVDFFQDFGSGGSSAVDGTNQTFTSATSWTRHSFTFSVPSISGKTVGTGSNIAFRFFFEPGVVETFDIWGFQVEAGSVATAFQTATGTLQGELAACQRYYQRYSQTAATQALIGQGSANSTTTVDVTWPITSSFRVFPTALDTSNVAIYQFSNATKYSTGTFSIVGSNGVPVIRYVHGSGVFTANNITAFVTDAGAPTVGYVGLSAEL
jgi:hypothetical protein